MHVQVLSNVSKCVADIHGAGYVHRDFTPTSIVYQPTSMKFVPIGFSSSERVGGTRAHSFALVYAAPEVVAYADEHPGSEKSLEASTAMDAWSMGVIAVQLLTGTAPLDVGVQGVETVRVFFFFFLFCFVSDSFLCFFSGSQFGAQRLFPIGRNSSYQLLMREWHLFLCREKCTDYCLAFGCGCSGS